MLVQYRDIQGYIIRCKPVFHSLIGAANRSVGVSFDERAVEYVYCPNIGGLMYVEKCRECDRLGWFGACSVICTAARDKEAHPCYMRSRDRGMSYATTFCRKIEEMQQKKKQKKQKKVKKCKKNLHISKKSCNFAPDLKNETNPNRIINQLKSKELC